MYHTRLHQSLFVPGGYRQPDDWSVHALFLQPLHQLLRSFNVTVLEWLRAPLSALAQLDEFFLRSDDQLPALGWKETAMLAVNRHIAVMFKQLR